MAGGLRQGLVDGQGINRRHVEQQDGGRRRLDFARGAVCSRYGDRVSVGIVKGLWWVRDSE